DGQRSHPAREPVPRRARAGGRPEGTHRRGPGRVGGVGGGARDLHARRHRLGGRGADRDRGARRILAGRADRDGGLAAVRGARDDGEQDLRPTLRVAELDLPAAQRGRAQGRAESVRHRRARRLRPQESVMASIDYIERIPNNVNLAENRRLLRALEDWQPKFLEWWRDMGPDGFQAKEVYLRTAGSVDARGWAQVDYTRVPACVSGIFLAEPEPERQINFGDHLGQPAWQEVPGEYRGTLRRLIVTQGDTEPRSEEHTSAL